MAGVAMTTGITMIVNLFIHPGQEHAFEAFEKAASLIMQRYDGRINSVIRPHSSPSGQPLPHEIHIVSFPSLDRFEQYRADDELARLVPLRQAAIAKTDIIIGELVEIYADSGLL